MSAGLFELRRDAITGWWVATVVDRKFDRGRFSLAAAQVDDSGLCQNCLDPPGDGVRLRVLKDYAFHVVGSEMEAREMERGLWPRWRSPRLAPPGAGGPSWRRRASIGRCSGSAAHRCEKC